MRSPVTALVLLGIALLPTSARAQETPDEIARRETRGTTASRSTSPRGPAGCG